MKALASCDICASTATLAELQHVLDRKKFDRYLDRESRRALTAYNKQDTRVTELLLDRLRPWIKGVNLGAYYLDEERRCPACGGTDLRQDGWYMATVQRYAMYRCACGALCRSQTVKHKTQMRGVA